MTDSTRMALDKVLVASTLLSILLLSQVCAFCAPPMPLLLGAEDSPVIRDVSTGLADLIPTLGVSGVLVWYLWYNESTAKPKMRDQFAEAVSKQQEQYAKALEEERRYNTDQIEKLCKALGDTGGKMDRLVEHCALKNGMQQ